LGAAFDTIQSPSPDFNYTMDQNMQQQSAAHYRHAQQMPSPLPVQHHPNQPQQSYQHYSQHGTYEHVQRGIHSDAQHSDLRQSAHYRVPQHYGPQIQQTSLADSSKGRGTPYTQFQHHMNFCPQYPSTTQPSSNYSAAPHVAPYTVAPNATYATYSTNATNGPMTMQPPAVGPQSRVPLGELGASSQQHYHGAERRILRPSGLSRGGLHASGFPTAPSAAAVPGADVFLNDENASHATENANKRLKTSKTDFSQVTCQANAQPITVPAVPSALTGAETVIGIGRLGKRKADGAKEIVDGAMNTTTTGTSIATPNSNMPAMTSAATQTRQPAHFGL
jgi:hypothetical protein